MKKIFLSAACIVCFGFVAQSENYLQVKIENELCVNDLTVVLSNESTQVLQLGCGGDYEMNLDELEMDYIILNGVQCLPDEVTEVTMDNRRVKVIFKKSKVTFGGGTVRIER